LKEEEKNYGPEKSQNKRPRIFKSSRSQKSYLRTGDLMEEIPSWKINKLGAYKIGQLIFFQGQKWGNPKRCNHTE